VGPGITGASLTGTALPALGLLAGGLGGPGTLDGTGAAARFNGATGVAADGAGNLYVTDWINGVVRKVVIATGAVTTFAGAVGQSGTVDGTGAAARFRSPSGITSDGAGNLYVTDGTPDSIRRIDTATGAVTTLAVVEPERGSFVFVAGAMVSDGASNLYVADQQAIRRIDIATGAVTTLAGAESQAGSADGTGAAARFDTPQGMTSDRAGNLYVADYANHTIRKLVIATGAVTTLAGAAGLSGSADGIGATARFNRPNAIASDGAGNLYVADSFNQTIRKLVIATGAVTTLAGAAGQSGSTDGTGTAARFYSPGGIASDGAGNLYVADNVTIRKVVIATAAVTTLAGAARQPQSTDGTGAAARFSAPQDIESDGAGNLYVADALNSAIRKITVATGAVTTFAGTPGQPGTDDGTGAAARFNAPVGIARDGAGNLYVTDPFNRNIRKIEIATGAVTTVAGSGSWGNQDGTGTAASFYTLGGIASDGAGNLYVGDSMSIRKIVIATREVTTLAVLPDRIDDDAGPFGIVIDGAGNLYVADATRVPSIRKIVIATGTVTTLAGGAGVSGTTDGSGPAAGFEAPGGIASDGAGNLYLADGTTVRKIAVDTATVSTIIGRPRDKGVSLGAFPASLSGAYGLAVLPTGELAIVDGIENAILIGHL
jgi:hypothetical protein